MALTKSIHVITAKRRIEATPERVYAIIADYHKGHPSILPGQFRNLIVEKGGVGAGTLISFQLRLLGRTRTYRASITEPEPGRVLLERGLDSETVTAFRVEPGPVGQSDVTIETRLMVWPGLIGQIQRSLMTWLLEPLYEKALKLLRSRTRPADARSPSARTRR